MEKKYFSIEKYWKNVIPLGKLKKKIKHEIVVKKKKKPSAGILTDQYLSVEPEKTPSQSRETIL